MFISFSLFNENPPPQTIQKIWTLNYQSCNRHRQINYRSFIQNLIIIDTITSITSDYDINKRWDFHNYGLNHVMILHQTDELSRVT
jgi:hypothetical protein